MSYMKYKNPIVFGRGPRSFEVTRGESPKNVRTWMYFILGISFLY